MNSFALGAFALAAAGTGAAQVPHDPEPTITVEGQLPERTRHFVETLTQTFGSDQQLARWNDPVCVATMGMDGARVPLADVQQSIDRLFWNALVVRRDPHVATDGTDTMTLGRFVVDRIRQVAETVDIPVAHGRCTPDILIVSASDADAFTRTLVKRHPALGRPRGFNGFGGAGLAPPSQIRPLLVSRPVRWFHTSATGPAADVGVGSGARSGWGSSFQASRIRLATRENMVLAMIVVDPDRVVGATWDQLADYLAMVALARPRLDADFRDAPSILSLFTPDGAMQDRVAALTPEDRAFLRALYASDTGHTATMQRANIVDRMRRPAPSTSR
ncbi:hypothetical protein [Sphingomonas nostoxanthinifaciens]|uniref:hypothetical protein n=1 Tax=Sphingomonas nostoxanthinifaciens TaxID=2872652 RepID=UPI001CC1F8A8|nr:hypothetical protein [Sphingomonas nostoxanthinifaciens]UAK25185.1 hypothetical protein K8P63_02990 [Sphingomonas nostoxanthinifaciens]